MEPTAIRSNSVAPAASTKVAKQPGTSRSSWMKHVVRNLSNLQGVSIKDTAKLVIIQNKKLGVLVLTVFTSKSDENLRIHRINIVINAEQTHLMYNIGKTYIKNKINNIDEGFKLLANSRNLATLAVIKNKEDIACLEMLKAGVKGKIQRDYEISEEMNSTMPLYDSTEGVCLCMSLDFINEFIEKKKSGGVTEDTLKKLSENYSKGAPRHVVTLYYLYHALKRKPVTIVEQKNDKDALVAGERIKAQLLSKLEGASEQYDGENKTIYNGLLGKLKELLEDPDFVKKLYKIENGGQEATKNLLINPLYHARTALNVSNDPQQVNVVFDKLINHVSSIVNTYDSKTTIELNGMELQRKEVISTDLNELDFMKPDTVYQFNFHTGDGAHAICIVRDHENKNYIFDPNYGLTKLPDNKKISESTLLYLNKLYAPPDTQKDMPKDAPINWKAHVNRIVGDAGVAA